MDVGLILVTFGDPGASILAHFGVLEATLGPQSLAESAKQFQAQKNHEKLIIFDDFWGPFSYNFEAKVTK